MNKPKTRNENIVIQEMNSEILIYDLKDNKAFCLNETSAIIYQLCDGKRTIADINKALSKQLNQPVNDELIWLALDGLKKEGLLENNEIEIDFNGMNRRQIIRKVGLASLIALPLVSTLVAPQAAQAGSCVGLGQQPPGYREITGFSCGFYNLTINSSFGDCFKDTLCEFCFFAQQRCCSGDFNGGDGCA